MIVDLPDTTTSALSKALVKIREEGGAVALGRVLTLVIATAISLFVSFTLTPMLAVKLIAGGEAKSSGLMHRFGVHPEGEQSRGDDVVVATFPRRMPIAEMARRLRDEL